MNRLSELAWHKFREQVAAHGGHVVETQWLGGHVRHRVICNAGHEAAPCPSSVARGGGICRPCSGTDPATVERAFKAVIEGRGGTVVEPTWLGSHQPHRVICSQGHETTPRPSSVVNKGTRCIVCTGKDQRAAWRQFCQIITERGGTVIESMPLGGNTPHRVRCPEGHESHATPSYVRVGGGMCHVCSPTSTTRAEQRFRDTVTILGGTVTESVWLGASKPHRVVCIQGHETTPRPSDVRRSGAICRVCSRHDSALSWREFQIRVSELGGTVVEPMWLGNKQQHRVVCKAGHDCSVRPNNVQQGSSICRTCAYKVWDVFYIVVNDASRMVKFGVTSHDPRTRLRFHQAAGYERVVKTITSLVDAQSLENAVLASLRLAGIAPVRGREYFDIMALPSIVAVVDSW